MEKIRKILEKIEDLEKRVLSLEEHGLNLKSEKSDVHNQSKKISIKEFILSKNLSGDVEKVLAMGYYLEKNEKAKSFNISDLGRLFISAKEKLPKNINDKVNMNIKKGHVMEVQEKKDGKKAWVLTATGETYVENNF